MDGYVRVETDKVIIDIPVNGFDDLINIIKAVESDKDFSVIAINNGREEFVSIKANEIKDVEVKFEKCDIKE